MQVLSSVDNRLRDVVLPHSAINSELPCISFNIFKFVGQVKVIFKGFFVVGNQMMYDLEHGYGMIFYQEETGSNAQKEIFYISGCFFIKIC